MKRVELSLAWAGRPMDDDFCPGKAPYRQLVSKWTRYTLFERQKSAADKPMDLSLQLTRRIRLSSSSQAARFGNTNCLPIF